MTWLESEHWPKETPGQRLQQLIDGPGIIQIPGAHNALAGLMANEQGSAVSTSPVRPYPPVSVYLTLASSRSRNCVFMCAAYIARHNCL